MNPFELGKKYDKIAQWWHDQHFNSEYGVEQFRKAIGFISGGGRALDVGCGVGGRFVHIMENHGLSVTGIDVSEEMIKLARRNHPQHVFLHRDICNWEPEQTFDFIVAWDSIFHLPLAMQTPVVTKLCNLLASGGTLLYTFGNDYGDLTDTWHDDTFYYSTIGINENLRLLMENGLSILHLELDQYPEKHVYTIAQRL